MQTLLAIESSSPVLSLALKTSKGKVYTESLKGLSSHAENILPILQRLLKKGRVSLEKINAFLIGRGPGSFTGLRVGFATVKGFLAVGAVECYGALSLDLIAENTAFDRLPENAKLAVALDAFRGKIYFRLYTRKSGNWKPDGEPQVLLPAEMLAALPDSAHVAGSALEKHGDFLKQNLGGKKISFAPEKDWHPSADALIRLFDKKDSRLESIPAHKLLPSYFRLSEAEERKQEHAAGC